ncbi:protein of unknown function [Acetanaerobacterium elongatum]|uniref:Uncharacterized protein n=2 Tax=Acetanaerobacterium elongatum TaxID=258515 RepID=A0A1H0EVS7_9FIRM|nr:protein of unknown function [Acetanaerobacterium elongatum]
MNKVPAPGFVPVVNPMSAAIPPRRQTERYKRVLSAAESEKGLAATVFSVAFGILFTETVFLGAMGISVTVLTAILCSFMLVYFHEKGERLSFKGVLLTVPIMLIAAGFGLHYNPAVQMMTVPALLGLAAVQAILLSGGRLNTLLSFDTLAKAANHLVARPLSFLDMPFRSLRAVRKIKSPKTAAVLKAAAGLALALPFGAILLLLFARADSVFESGLNYITQTLHISFGKLITDLLLGSTGAIVLGAYLIAAKVEGKEPAKDKAASRFIDTTVGTAFLSVINLILLLFVAVQFQYLFAGSAGRMVSGLSYAEYARKGFFELSWASGLCFAAAVFILCFCKKGQNGLPIAVRVLVTLMCTCNGVILASAVLRMGLYVQAYGLSVKRLLTLWFMAVIGVCLIWLVLQCISEQFNALRFIGATAIVFVCVLSLVNVDRLIAHYNIERYIKSPAAVQLDASYLSDLSYSALPEVAQLYTSLKDDSQPLRNELNGVMEEMRSSYEGRHRIYGFTAEDAEISGFLASVSA